VLARSRPECKNSCWESNCFCLWPRPRRANTDIFAVDFWKWRDPPVDSGKSSRPPPAADFSRGGGGGRLHSAGAVLVNIFPSVGHNTTGFVNHIPTILYLETNLYLRKFWYFWPKLLELQICSWVQDCWLIVHKTSCIMPAMREMAGKTASAKCRKHTSHITSASIAQAFVFGWRKHKFEL